tara:strand:+ start:318 stop:419 length:102 start_codon:yes stop_codon:yes gene_type:complete
MKGQADDIETQKAGFMERFLQNQEFKEHENEDF